jgi:hypothetical protein
MTTKLEDITELEFAESNFRQISEHNAALAGACEGYANRVTKLLARLRN